MSIDDFYKVYGYACFYKADSNIVDDISIKEMTISLVCEGYPRKLIEHLEHVRGFLIKKEETGIYYVYGDIMPIQIITTKYLSPEKNLWLRSLTDSLADKAIVQKLIKEYEKPGKYIIQFNDEYHCSSKRSRICGGEGDNV